MPAIAEAAIQIVPDFDRFGRELDTGLKRSLRSAGGGISKIMRMATQATAALGGAMGIVGAQSLRMSADVEKSIQMIEGLVGIFDPVQLNSFKDAINEIAPATGQSAAELAKAMFFITSAGARGSTAIEILDSTARLGAAGLGDLAEIARGIVSAVNAYGESNITAAHAADIFANTVRMGNLEATSLAPVLGHVIPIASQMGVSFEQVGAALAGMTRLGSSASESAVALRATLSGILKPTGRADEAFASVGLSAEQLRNALTSGQLDLLGVLELLKKAFDGNTAAMAEAFPNLRALRGVLALVGNNLETNRMITDALADSTGVANEAYEAQADTLQFKLNQMLSAYKTANIAIGDALKPYVIPLLERFTNLLTRQTTELPKTIVKLIEYFKILTGRGDVLEFINAYSTQFGLASQESIDFALKLTEIRETALRVFDQIKLSFTTLVQAFMDNFGDLLPQFDGFSFTMQDVANAIILAMQMATTFLANTVFPRIRLFINNSIKTFNSLKPQLILLMAKVKEVFENIINFVMSFVNQFIIIWDKYGKDITEIAKRLFTGIAIVIKGAFDLIVGIARTFIALFSGDFEMFSKGIKGIVEGLFTFIFGAFKLLFASIDMILLSGTAIIKNLFKFMGIAVKETIVNMKNAVIDDMKAISNIGTVIFQGLKDTFVSLFSGIGTAAKEMWQSLKDFFRKGYDFLIEKTSVFGDFIVNGGFGDMIARVIEKVKGFFGNLKDKFLEWFGSGGKLRFYIEGFMDFIIDKFLFGFNFLFTTVKTVFAKIGDFIRGFTNGSFKEAIKGMFNGIVDLFERGINRIIDTLNKVIDKANSILPGPDLSNIPTVDFGGLKDGGTALTSGTALVGESGPELINLNRGASVIPLRGPTGSATGLDVGLARLLAKQVQVTIELDSETIARKTAPIMVDEIRLRSGLTIV